MIAIGSLLMKYLTDIENCEDTYILAVEEHINST